MQINRAIFLIIYLVPALAFANGETPVSEGLQYIIGAMYGATGVTIATISVMVVGLLCLIHMLRWVTLGYTIVGIAMIFGASAIVHGITSLIHNF